MDFLKQDSGFMGALNVLANLMFLNFYTLLFCLPIVTAGASLTAMHYVLQKMVRDEDGDIWQQFFRSFKLNFRQATTLWVIMLFIFAVLFVDWRIIRMQGDEFAGIIIILLYAAIALIYLISLYIFPVLARYKNTIGGTVKTSFAMAVYGMTRLRTVICGIINIVPLVLLFLLGYAVVPVFLAFCFTGPAYARARIYKSLFDFYETGGQLEINEEEQEEETE